MQKVMSLVCLLTLIAMPALAGTVTVRAKSVKSEFGQVRFTICKLAEFKEQNCALKQSVDAHPGDVEANFANVEPGNYAVKVYHDQNSNNELDRGFLGFVPIEGYGFSRLQTKVSKFPDFEDATVYVGNSDTVIEITMNYP